MDEQGMYRSVGGCGRFVRQDQVLYALAKRIICPLARLSRSTAKGRHIQASGVGDDRAQPTAKLE
ncbi:hypothetical protein D3C71_1868420 [compost metagenome]